MDFISSSASSVLQMGASQTKLEGPPAAAAFSLVTLEFLVVFGPVRLAPPQGARVVPRNTAVHHSVCLPPLQHVQPGSQEGQILSLASQVSLPSGFSGLHLRQ